MQRIAFTDEMDRSLRTSWTTGEPIKRTVERLKVSRSTLYRRAGELGLAAREPTKAMGYYRRPKVYPHAHPLVQQLFDEARRQRANLTQIAEACGVTREAINAWGNTASPLLVNLEAAANYLGMELRFARKGDG